MSYELIFLINTFASFFMTGLIWTVQQVHYPSFHFVGTTGFKGFQQHHVHSIGKIVVPIMIIEIGSSLGLAWMSGWLSLDAMGFYVVILIWITTGLFSVPEHAKLETGKDDKVISRLVSTNWIRTLLWTLKSGISFFLLWQMV